MFCYNFDSFVPVIILKTCTFKYSGLFATPTLLAKLLKVLRLSNLTANV